VLAAARAVHALASIPLRGIPTSLMHNAAGVAVIPHVVKVGLVIDGRFGRGVILVHEPNGRWSHPVFVTLSGAGIGTQAGVEETDLVLVFKTRKSLERALKGKGSLGGDFSVAAGPLGREAEADHSPGHLKADVVSYSRSRGLFAGVSLQGAHLHIDRQANKAFYGLRHGHPEDVFGVRKINHIAAVQSLQAQVSWLSGPPPVQNGPVVLPPAPPTQVVVPVVPAPAPEVLVPVVPVPAPRRR
jgi:lipid-binding SYLF domain-containing protein